MYALCHPFHQNTKFDHNKIPPQKNTEDNFYEVQMIKCTKTLYKTGTIRPALLPYFQRG